MSIDLIANLALLVILATLVVPRSLTAIGTFLADVRSDRLVRASWGSMVDGAAVVGPTGENTGIVEFLDYQCPSCRASHATWVRAGEPEAVAIRHLPLSIHPRAREAALVSICAQWSGNFRQVHDHLLTQNGWFDADDWAAELTSAGVPKEAAVTLVRCMGSDAARTRLEADIALAERLRIQATPTFVTIDGVAK